MKQCQAHVSAKEFAYWLAYGMIEPYGPRAEDRRAGTVAAAMVNLYLDKKKQQKPYTWLDFFPEFAARTEVTVADLLKKVELANTLLGGADLRKKG